MSDAVFAGLPRFDAGAGSASARAPGSWRNDLGGGVPADTGRTRPQADGARPAAPRAETPVIEAPPQPVDLAMIEASLGALSSKLDKIEREAQAQTVQTISSIAAKLFPELSKQFLAAEINQHLVSMVPASAAVVEIRAETELAGKLRELVECSPSLAHRCTVLPAAAEGQGRVDVSWQSGGLTFNFDGLLQACLSRLNSTQTTIKE